tara:strand:+ start:805 stop:957 length:153 start_codon:yes stop_codon:yes gene_type:complete
MTQTTSSKFIGIRVTEELDEQIMKASKKEFGEENRSILIKKAIKEYLERS